MAATLTLDQIAQIARSHSVTPEERRAQRISMISGMLSKGSRRTLTRDKVADLLNEIEGHGDIATEKVAR